MSSPTTARARAHPETAGQITSPTICSVDGFVERLGEEVSAARDRVRSLQTEAATACFGQEQRFLRFVAVADRIHSILLPRIEAFTTVDIFKEITQRVSQEGQGLDVRGFHGRTTTLLIPFSDACPAKVELSFHVDHDGSVENAILDYRLEILPIFIKFNSHDQLIIPIADPIEDTIGTWIEDKLVGFTQTFFKMYFHDEYQKKHLETDPVMKIQFPRTFAIGKKEYRGRLYHFYTKESLQAFETDPSEYVTTR